MSLQPVLRYSLDLSGSDPDNKVVGEVHSLAPVAPNRSIAPYYGSFYTDGLKVRDVGGIIEATAYTNIPLTGSAPLVIGAVDLGDNPVGFKRIRLANQDVANDNGFYQYQVTGSNYTLTPMALGALLTPGVDYVPTMLQQDATRVSGKEVCQLVVITNETLMNDVVLEYQAVGGEYSVSSDALDQLIATLNLDNRPVAWGEIIGIPNTFPPVDHLHHIQDFKGFGHVVDAIDEIRALLTGGVAIDSGGGGGTPEIVYGEFPSIALINPVIPEWSYIGSVSIPAAFGPSDQNSVALFIDAADYSAKLTIFRNGGTPQIQVLSGQYSINPIYFYYDEVNNKIELFMRNTSDRDKYVVWSTYVAYVTLNTSHAMPYTPPGTSADRYQIQAHDVVYDNDVQPIFVALTMSLNNMSSYFEQHHRGIE